MEQRFTATMFPCHVSQWSSAEPPAPCGTHASTAQPPPPLAQPLPDLLCSCPAPSLNTQSESPSPDPMESLIIITEYEPSQPGGTAGEEEEEEAMESSETPAPASSVDPPFRTPSCDLLSHTVGRPESLFPGPHGQRGRLSLSDRKLSLQERSHTAMSPCGSPGLNGRYIYPSLPYSPITSPHSSPRLPRRPTVESHRVSITDLRF